MKKYLIIIFVLFQSISLFSKKENQVMYNYVQESHQLTDPLTHTEIFNIGLVTDAEKQLILNDSPSQNSLCFNNILEKVELKLTYKYGLDDYEEGLATYSSTIQVTIDAFDIQNTTTRITGFIPVVCDLTIESVADMEYNPESICIKDITDQLDNLSLSNAIFRLTSINNQSGTILNGMYLDAELIVDRRIEKNALYLQEIQMIEPSGINIEYSVTENNEEFLTGAHIDFKWEFSDQGDCIEEETPIFELQILRLFNDDFSNVNSQEDLHTLVNWENALFFIVPGTGSSVANNFVFTKNIAITEGTGYYIWRIRAITDFYKDFNSQFETDKGGIADERNWGNWNYPKRIIMTPPPPQQIDLVQGYELNISMAAELYGGFYFHQMDSNINWKYERIFTEGNNDTKILEKIEYADNLLNIRQNQKYIASDNSKLVNQSIYDYVGRKAITTLPVPFDAVSNGPLGYQRNFAEVSDDDLFSYEEFDDGRLISPNMDTPPGMANSSVNEYYSGSIQIGSDIQGEERVPSSSNTITNPKFYPYKRTIYDNNPLSEVREVSGFGEEFAVGSTVNGGDHTTKIFRSEATEDELIFLFGDETPRKDGIRKVLKKDPNGVISIEYYNSNNQLIASALKNSTSNSLELDPLDITTTPDIEKEEEYSESLTYTINEKVFDDEGYTTFKTLYFPDETEVELYHMIQQNYIEESDGCVDKCIKCTYYVTYKIIDAETLTDITSGLIPIDMDYEYTLLDPQNPSINCDIGPTTSNPPTITLGAGSYIFKKKVVTYDENEGVGVLSELKETVETETFNTLFNAVEISVIDELEDIIENNEGLKQFYDDLDLDTDWQFVDNSSTEEVSYYLYSTDCCSLKINKVDCINCPTDLDNGNYQKYLIEEINEYLLSQGISASDLPRTGDDEYENVADESANPEDDDTTIETYNVFPYFFRDDYQNASGPGLNNLYPELPLSPTPAPPNSDVDYFDEMITNMDPDGMGSRFDENEVCDCWVSSVSALKYTGITIDPNLPKGYEFDESFDLLDAFLNCVDQKYDANDEDKDICYRGYTYHPFEDPFPSPPDAPNEGYLSHAFEYFYFDPNSSGAADEPCLEILSVNFKDPTSLDEWELWEYNHFIEPNATFGSTALTEYGSCEIIDENTLQNEMVYTKFYNCLRSSISVSEADDVLDDEGRKFCGDLSYSDFVNGTYSSFQDFEDELKPCMENACKSACDDKFQTFVDRLTLLYNTEGYSVQGQDFYQEYPSAQDFVDPNGDGDWDIIERFRMEYSTNKGHTIDIEEIYCMATALVDNCKLACTVEFKENPGAGEEHIMPDEGFMKVFQSDFELSFPNPADPPNTTEPYCDSGFDLIAAPTTLNVVKWQEYVITNMNKLLDELILYNPHVPADKGEYGYLGSNENNSSIIYSGGVVKNYHYNQFGCCIEGLEFEFESWLDEYTSNHLYENDNYNTDKPLEAYNYRLINTLLSELYKTTGSVCTPYPDNENPCDEEIIHYIISTPESNYMQEQLRGTPPQPCVNDKLFENQLSDILDSYRLFTGFADLSQKYEILPPYFEFDVNGDLYLKMPYIKRNQNPLIELDPASPVIYEKSKLILKDNYFSSTPEYCVSDIVVTCDNDICFKWRDYDIPVIADENIQKNVKKKCDNIIASKLLADIQTDMAKCANDEAIKVVENYKEACKAPPIDNFSVNITGPGYYHYTLYYYDRAGNLVKTVPPNGIHFDVTADRDDAMNHTFESTYEYDTKNAVITENVPDRDLPSKFIYNKKNQLVFSYDARQYDMINDPTEQAHFFSYTIYDDLGRVIETGQAKVDMQDLTAKSISVGFLLHQLDKYLEYFAVDESRLETFQTGLDKNMYIKTFYDEFTSIDPNRNLNPEFPQQGRNLENRINLLLRDEDGNPLTKTDIVKTYYSYDLLGNVEWVMNCVPTGEFYYNSLTDIIGITYYNYDLISGNVTQISYNPGRYDSYYHRYNYDEDQRLIMVETSRFGKIWDKDTKYEYYKHGPLKRTLVGEDMVQGIDYTYTINGWLKAINHSVIGSVGTRDPSMDGATGGDMNLPPDGFGMVLNYFDGDYLNDDYTHLNSANSSTLTGKDLYNGNIATWAFSEYDSDIDSKLVPPELTNGFKYEYDVLNRLKKSTESYYSPFQWNAKSYDDYKSTYKYDPNGNLLNLTRNASNGMSLAEMDDLDYDYSYSVGNIYNNNRLNFVTDNVALPPPGLEDIQQLSTSNYNYTYDASGNLIEDERSDIENIYWTADGKIKEIDFTGFKNDIEFLYDALGNRVSKKVDGISNSYYLYEANDKIMAIYESERSVTSSPDYELCFKYIDDGNNIKESCALIDVSNTDPTTHSLNAYKFVPVISDQNSNSPSSNELVAINLENMTLSVEVGNPTTYKTFEIIEFGFYENNPKPITISEWHLWGNGTEGRIGVRKPNIDVRYHNHILQNPYPTTNFARDIREKSYELKDHLGNVRVTYSDLKRKVATDDFALDLINTTNYYPFGMQMKLRTFNNTTENFHNGKLHRYGFQGQEKDDEIKGEGNHYNFYGYGYMPRLGKRMKTDPNEELYPNISPFAYVINNPISVIDPDGKDIYLVIWSTDFDNDSYGHAAIAVDNYDRVETKSIVNNQEITKVTYEKNGTVSYYDLWPITSVGSDKESTSKWVPADYQQKSKLSNGITITSKMLLNYDVSEREGGTPANGVISIKGDNNLSVATINRIKKYIKDNPNYCGQENNCSDFALSIINTVRNGVNIQGGDFGKEDFWFWEFTTPNELFNDTKRLIQKTGQGTVLKEEGDFSIPFISDTQSDGWGTSEPDTK